MARPRRATGGLVSNQFQHFEAFAARDLLGVGDEAAVLFGGKFMRVPAAKSSARLRAAVQHDDQGAWLVRERRHAGDIEFVIAFAGGVAHGFRDERTGDGRQIGRRRMLCLVQSGREGLQPFEDMSGALLR